MDLYEQEDELSWYCIRTQPRCENVALINLQRLSNIDVFYPRACSMKITKKGKRKMVQPLFPNYIFARFDLKEHTRAVNYAQGVSYVIKKGNIFTKVDPIIISELLMITDDGVLNIQDEPLQVGDSTRFITGLFNGNQCTVTELIPARQRVKVLLEFMGNPITVEVNPDDLEAKKSFNPLAQG
jgi:transcriptional antiterminator RfaH